MIKGIERNQTRMSKTKKQMYQIKRKELSDEDKIWLQLIKDAVSTLQSGIKDARIKSMPTVPTTLAAQMLDEMIRPKSIKMIETKRLSSDKQSQDNKQTFEQPKETSRSHKYYKNKYQEADGTTAQIESEEIIQKFADEQPKLKYLSHPNQIMQKFVINTIWRMITHRQQGVDFKFSSQNFIKFWSFITQNIEQDVEIVLEEAIVQSHSCIPRKYKKKDLIRVQDILIKNVSVKVLDNEFSNSIEQLYRVNCDFISISVAPEVEITDNDY